MKKNVKYIMEIIETKIVPEILGTITAYNADCMDIMKQYPDKYFDLAIVDPPYGLGIDGQKKQICKNPKHNRKEHQRKEWDSKIPDKEYFDQLFRVSKNQVIWGGNYFTNHINGSKGWIIWDKGQYGLTMSDAELAYSSYDSPTRVIKINRCELRTQNTIHPTEKPISLYYYLLNRFGFKGCKIIDTHGGSMSHAIAAYDLGFDLTIIEKDEDYFNEAINRLKWYQRQLKLF